VTFVTKMKLTVKLVTRLAQRWNAKHAELPAEEIFSAIYRNEDGEQNDIQRSVRQGPGLRTALPQNANTRRCLPDRIRIEVHTETLFHRDIVDELTMLAAQVRPRACAGIRWTK